MKSSLSRADGSGNSGSTQEFRRVGSDERECVRSNIDDGSSGYSKRRVWLTGSLLAVGDALKDNDYFDHAPELELVYHLRNGIAHGNRFHIANRKRLTKYPAHNRACYKNTIFEITPAVNQQPVLFDFLGAGDVLDLLFSVALHFDEIGRGEL